MSDPVYRKLKDDMRELLADLWHLLFPVSKPVPVAPPRSHARR